MEFNASPKPAVASFSNQTVVGRVANFILARPALALAVIMSAVGSIGLLAWFLLEASIATDFSVYWRTANEPFQMAYMRRDELPFPYAPTMLLWISLLAVLPMWPAFALWVLFSSFALAKVCRAHLSPRETWLVLASPIVVNGLATGQVSVFLAAALLWAAGTNNRLLAGLGFALIASVKPQLVLLAPLLLLARKDWLALGAASIGYIAIVILSVVVFGIAPWFEWIASMENFHRVLLDQNVTAVAATPAGAAEHWGLPPLPFLAAGLVAGTWLMVRCRNDGPLEVCAAIAVGSLLAAPYALTYDLAPVVPFLVCIIFRGSIAGAVALGVAIHPIPLILASVELARSRRHTRRSETIEGKCQPN